MTDGINIDITANADSVIAAAKDVDKAFDKVSDSLDDLAKDSAKSGDKAGEKLADGIEDGTKDADRAVDRLEDSFKDLSSEASTAGKRAGDDLGDGVNRGTKKGVEGVHDLRDESKQSAREGAASFSGEFSDVGDFLQEVAANAFSGFGPAGAAAGIAAAVGIGFITSALQGAGDNTEAVKEKTQALAQDYIDTAGVGASSLDFLIESLKEMATETEDGKTKLTDLKKTADQSGGSFEDLAQAYGTNVDALKEMWREASKRESQAKTEAEQIGVRTDLTKKEQAAILDKADAAERYTDYVGQAKGAAEEAAEAERLWLEAGGAALEAKAGSIESINDAYDDAAEGVSDFINAETGIFDTAAYLASMEARATALANYQTNLAAVQLTPNQLSYLNSLGAEQASAVLEGYVSASPEIQGRLGAVWEEAGRQNSGEWVSGFGTPEGKATVTVTADDKPANESIRSLQEKDRPAKPVTVSADTTKAEQQTQAAANKQYSTTIKVSADTGSAQTALDNFVSRNSGRSIRYTADVRDRNGKPVL